MIKGLLGLASATTNLGKQQINTEWSVLVVQITLELSNLLLEHLGSIANTADDTQTTGISDSSSQLRAGGHVHACQQNGVVDLKQIGDGSADDL